MSELTDNQARGHKANLANPNTSEESKEHSKEVLASYDGTTTANDKEFVPSADKENEIPADEHDNRVLGGHKASLSNPNVSEEAKEHSKQVLEQAGESVE